MSEHITEEEQIEALKRWWNENGRSLVIGVVLAVAGYFGWQGWQAQQQQAREAASILYTDLLEAGNVAPGQQITEDQAFKIKGFASTLKETYGNTLYAAEAALVLAKVSVEQKDFALAESELRWVIETEINRPITLLARQRLAQVLYGQEKYDDALSVLKEVEPGAFAAVYAELEGDIYVAQQKIPEAISAYELAMEQLLEPQASRNGIIQMKLDDIQIASTDSVAAPRSEPAAIETESEADESDSASPSDETEAAS
ncbi:YfgM family protein [Aurantivibrio infirmus]